MLAIILENILIGLLYLPFIATPLILIVGSAFKADQETKAAQSSGRSERVGACFPEQRSMRRRKAFDLNLSAAR
jgi:hypothetical protein